MIYKYVSNKFKLFGHENLSILDGGINLWKQQQGQITNEEPNYKVVFIDFENSFRNFKINHIN